MYDQAGNIVDRRELLKIKIKSLAEEARIIRKEEKKVGTLRYVFVPPQPLSKENMKRWTRSQRERMLHGYWRRVRMSVNPLSDEMYHHSLTLGHETRLTQVAYALDSRQKLRAVVMGVTQGEAAERSGLGKDLRHVPQVW
jgi:hypothetical protein